MPSAMVTVPRATFATVSRLRSRRRLTQVEFARPYGSPLWPCGIGSSGDPSRIGRPRPISRSLRNSPTSCIKPSPMPQRRPLRMHPSPVRLEHQGQRVFRLALACLLPRRGPPQFRKPPDALSTCVSRRRDRSREMVANVGRDRHGLSFLVRAPQRTRLGREPNGRTDLQEIRLERNLEKNPPFEGRGRMSGRSKG
jgi:hypothetical protein